MERIVEVYKVSTIVPATPAPRYAHFLSNLDLRFDNDNYYAQCVFIFRAGISADELPSVMQSLKRSLSTVLVDFSVLAGRLSKSSSGRTEVDVNSQGIPFYEARCDARLGDWPELRSCPIDLQLNPENKAISNLLEVPLIRLQATWFQCGGLALGFSALHMLVDGANAIDLMKAWGEIHRELPIATPPQFVTWMLKARDPPIVTVPLDANFSFSEPKDELPVQAREDARWPLKTVVFRMDDDMVDECVEEVEKGPFQYGRATSYEAISALFWSSIMRAKCPDLSDDLDTSYTVPMSVTRKGRFDPPLPSGYFGNAVVMGLATSSAANVGGRHFSFAAKLIHDKARSYSIEFAKSVIDLFELRLQQGKTAAGLRIGEGPPSGRDILSTNFVAFSVYDIDFGWAGRKLEQYLFSFPMENGEGVISILPTARGGRSREVAVCLREDQLKKLMDDATLRRFCVY